MIRNTDLDELIEYRSEIFSETYEFVTLKNGEKGIMFFPRGVDDSINVTMFIEDDYCRLLASFNDMDKKVFLGDIRVLQDKFMNIGIGSILLNKLIEIAKKEKVNQITGWMDYQSEEQKERQIAFYKKNGFTIDGKGNLLYEISFE